jgi:hypothetical protein
MDYTVVVVAQGDAAPGLLFVTPYDPIPSILWKPAATC